MGDFSDFLDDFARRSAMHPLGQPVKVRGMSVEFLHVSLTSSTVYETVGNASGSTNFPSVNTNEGKYLIQRGIGSPITLDVSYSKKASRNAPWQHVQAALLSDHEMGALFDRVIYGDEAPHQNRFLVVSRHVYVGLLPALALAGVIERAGKHLKFKVTDWFGV